MKICINCFNDIEIIQYIQTNFTIEGECDYCHDGLHSKLIDINELLDFFAEFISIFQISPTGVPLFDLIQNDWNLFSNNAGSRLLLDDILTSLDAPFHEANTLVSYTNEIIECVAYWEELKEKIKWENRFLTNIDKLEELHWHHLFNRTVLLSEDELLYRARLHYDDNQAVFDTGHMGCPERSKTNAGRANPQGIPYLYLSRTAETTLYEIRATYLDELSVGTFKVNADSEIILVDFTESVSAFYQGEESISELTKSMLLKRAISADLSKPIRRYDSVLEYIPTQFICEYIKYLYSADGIIFDSSLHQGGKNIVLFNQQKVECTIVQKYRTTMVAIQSAII